MLFTVHTNGNDLTWKGLAQLGTQGKRPRTWVYSMYVRNALVWWLKVVTFCKNSTQQFVVSCVVTTQQNFCRATLFVNAVLESSAAVVRMYVALAYCIQTDKDIVKLFFFSAGYPHHYTAR